MFVDGRYVSPSFSFAPIPSRKKRQALLDARPLTIGWSVEQGKDTQTLFVNKVLLTRNIHKSMNIGKDLREHGWTV